MTKSPAQSAREMLEGLRGVTGGEWTVHEWEGLLKQTDIRIGDKTVLQVPWHRGTGCSAHRDAAHLANCSPDNLRPILEAAIEAEGLRAEVERLRAEQSELIAIAIMQGRKDSADEIARLQGVIATMGEALEPFARIADEWDPIANGGHVFADEGDFMGHGISIGDLRRARTARRAG